MNKKLRSSFILLLTAFIWGIAFVAQRVGADYMGTLTFNGIRFILGALSLIPVIAIFERKKVMSNQERKLLIKYAILAGLVLFVASTLQQQGIMISGSAGKASFITGLYTVFVPVCGLFVHKRVSASTWFGVVFAVAGLYLVSVGGSDGFGIGDVLVLIGTFFWTAHIIIIERATKRVSALRFAMGQFLFCGVLSMLFACIFETITLSAIRQGIIPILYGGFMSVGVAYTCQIIGQKDSDPTAAAIILSTESVFGAVGGALLLNERMSIRGYVGCVLIFAGIVLAQLTFPLKKTKFRNNT